ncbi:MAG: hypothetical protein AAF487_04710 [Bacteroidota bacterium]
MKFQRCFYLILISLLPLITSAQAFYTYVCDAANFTNGPWKIVQFDQNGENPIDFIVDELSWPQDILFLEDQGVVLISNLSSGRITKYNSSSGIYIEDFALVQGGPTRMKIGEDGLLYVIQWSNSINKVLRFQLDGTYVDEFTSSGVAQSIGIDWDSQGNVYVSSFQGASIRKFDSEGNDQGLFISSNLSGPTNIEIKEDTMYVLDWNAGKLVRFNMTDGSFIDDFISVLTNPEGLAFMPNGDLLIGDNALDAARRFDELGNDLGSYTSGGDLSTPNAVVLRNAIFVSNEELSLNDEFVSPTIGDSFTFNIESISQISNLYVYSIAGQMIDTIRVDDLLNWTPDYLAEGSYLILGTAENGFRLSQKIVISRR